MNENRNAHLLAHKIAMLIKHGNVHIRNSDDFLEYLQLNSELARLVESETVLELIDAHIDKLMEESDG